MKHFILMAGLCLLAASCSNESVENLVENNVEQVTAPVRVRVSDFSMSMSEIAGARALTRGAVDPASYNGVGAVTLAFYDAEGTEVVKMTQVKGDGTYTTFGEFTANLPVGNYTMVAIARALYDGDEFFLTSPTEAGYTSDRPRETFTKVQNVTVTSASPLDLDVTLKRISTWLRIVSTDGRPASAAKLRTTFGKGGKDFNPTTGLVLTNTGFSQINSPSSAVGATIEINILPFLASADDAEEKMTVTIEALDADDHVLATKVVENVPFQRNCKTTMTGAVYTAGTSSAAFQIETSWGAGKSVDF